MYDPNGNEFLDFEIGGIFDKVKKVGKGAMRGVGKFTDATITKPSAFIGKTIGGKRGEAIGRKLGGFTAKVTNLGVGAGMAGAAAGLAPGMLTHVGVGMAGKKILGGSRKKRRSGGTSSKSGGGLNIRSANSILAGRMGKSSLPCSGYNPAGGYTLPSLKNDNAMAARVAAMLAKSLGGPLASANKALKLAELQRQATYEHNKLMTDSEFRKKVLAALTVAASNGNSQCQRTIRVLVGR